MPDYLLDTMILEYWYNAGCPEHANVLARVQDLARPDPHTGYIPRLFLSVVTVGEIEYGHRISPRPDQRKQAEFLTFVREQCPEPLEITDHDGAQYGELRAWLFGKFSLLGKRTKAKRAEELVDPTTARELGVQENDIWIAAQAMNHKFVLVTHDSRGNFGALHRQFANVLQVEDWAR